MAFSSGLGQDLVTTRDQTPAPEGERPWTGISGWMPTRQAARSPLSAPAAGGSVAGRRDQRQSPRLGHRRPSPSRVTSASRRELSPAGSSRCSRRMCRRSSSRQSRRAAAPRATSATPSLWPRCCASVRSRRKVYKQRGRFTQLAYLAKAYQMLVSDDVRVQNRIKSLLRSRGVQVAGSAVYTDSRPEPTSTSSQSKPMPMADFFYQQHDQLTELRQAGPEADDRRSAQAPRVSLREELPRPRRSAHRTPAARGRHTLPLREQASRSGPTAVSRWSAAARPTGCGPAPASG